MVSFRLIGCVLSAHMVANTVGSYIPRDVVVERAAAASATTDPQITSYVTSIPVPTPQVAAVTSALQSDPNVSLLLKGQPFVQAAITTVACEVLKLILGTAKVDTKPVDTSLVELNWSQTCWKTPSCVVIAQDKTDVSVALKTIKFLKLPFATRSGGHSPNPGAASISEPGVLIDLQKLKQISVSADKKVATVGPGGRWGDVYAALDPYGVGVIGGRIPQVGVGGLILGGGYFHFSSEYGLAADNVKNFEVVLADGSIVNANAQQNTDLFWALKGGGPNFGIVTKFDLYTIPQKDIWFTVSAYSSGDAYALIDAFANWQKTNTDNKATVAMVINLDTITFGLLYATTTPPAGTFKAFDGLPTPLAVAVPPTNGTFTLLATILGSSQSTEPRHDYRGISTGVDAQLYKDVYSSWKQKASDARAATGATMTFVLQPVFPGLTAASNARGGNPLGIQAKTQQWWTTLMDWTDAKDDDTVRGVSIATTDTFKQQSKQRGLDVPYIFMNDASRDQNPIAGYGAANVQKLKTIAKKYDPTAVFQNQQQGGFLLKNA